MNKIFILFAFLLQVTACGHLDHHRGPPADDLGPRWPPDEVVERWPLDLRLDVAIERILELRDRAQRGDPVAHARLGPALDAEEAELWRARQTERERLALSRLAADGVIDGSGAARVNRSSLSARFEEARSWISLPRRSRHFEDLSTLGSYALARQLKREGSLALAEMEILRRLFASAPE
ncbi:MAG: hypothetical protein NBV67_08710 [Tagaea sp.]|nr:hypothetical protein [Tagaea sp.]